VGLSGLTPFYLPQFYCPEPALKFITNNFLILGFGALLDQLDQLEILFFLSGSPEIFPFLTGCSMLQPIKTIARHLPGVILHHQKQKTTK
jgi:hypothetical protein